MPRQNLIKFSWISPTSTEIRTAYIACFLSLKLFKIWNDSIVIKWSNRFRVMVIDAHKTFRINIIINFI